MTVSTQVNRLLFKGDGVTQVFPTNPSGNGFYFNSSADVACYLRTDSTGAVALLVNPTHFSVAGAGMEFGGNVSMITAPAVGETLIVIHDPQYHQNADMVALASFPGPEFTQSLDRAAHIGISEADQLESVLLTNHEAYGQGFNAFDAGGRRIINGVDPVFATDAVTKQWMATQIAAFAAANPQLTATDLRSFHLSFINDFYHTQVHLAEFGTTDALHTNRSGAALHAAATPSTAGFMPSADVTNLATINADTPFSVQPLRGEFVITSADMASYWSTPPSDITFEWFKWETELSDTVGRLVHVRRKSGGTTGISDNNAVLITPSTPPPSHILPSSLYSMPTIMIDNGRRVLGNVRVSDAGVTFLCALWDTDSGNNQADLGAGINSWTPSGEKGFPADFSFTYIVVDP